MDQAGLWVRLLPEWAHTRSRPQRNAYHRYTVDRHLWETAAQAATLTRRVHRPDLLLLGALLHDIGKGLTGDHTERGVEVVGRLGPRLGLPSADTATLVTLVRQHLLLPDVAARRDLADPLVINAVAQAVGDRDTLELLAALTEADARATGPAAWSPWKDRLLTTLVTRVREVLAGAPAPPPALSDRARQLLADRQVVVDIEPVPAAIQVQVAAPDRTGLLATVAGVLAVHRLEIVDLRSLSEQGFAVLTALAHPRFGSGPQEQLLRAELLRALADPGRVSDQVQERAAAYPRPPDAQPPAIGWVLREVSAPVLEVRAPDGVGVLHKIAAALSRCEVPVHSARCQTLGADVVDSFSVPPLDAQRREQVAAAVLAALA